MCYYLNMRKIIFLIIIFSIICFSCNKQTNNSQDNTSGQSNIIDQKRVTKITNKVWSIGIGRSRIAAKLSAQTFLAQQIGGINFKYSNEGIRLDTGNVILTDITEEYYRPLSDGRLLCVMKMEKTYQSQTQFQYYTVTKNVSLEKLLNNRTAIFESVIKNIFLTRISSENQVIKGKILIISISGINKVKDLSSQFELKLRIIE